MMTLNAVIACFFVLGFWKAGELWFAGVEKLADRLHLCRPKPEPPPAMAAIRNPDPAHAQIIAKMLHTPDRDWLWAYQRDPKLLGILNYQLQHSYPKTVRELYRLWNTGRLHFAPKQCS